MFLQKSHTSRTFCKTFCDWYLRFRGARTTTEWHPICYHTRDHCNKSFWPLRRPYQNALKTCESKGGGVKLELQRSDFDQTFRKADIHPVQQSYRRISPGKFACSRYRPRTTFFNAFFNDFGPSQNDLLQ